MKTISLKISYFFKRELIILYSLILIGSYLRLPGVFTDSFAFTYDVGRDLLAVSNIIESHKIPLIGATTGLPGVFYGPWWYYLLTPLLIVSFDNPQGIALAMVLFGIFSIILSYVVGNKIGGKFLGIFLAGLATVSPVMISLSSQIWNPNIAPFLVLLVLLVLNRIFSKEENLSKYYFLLGILLALNMDIEIIFGLFLSVGVIISVVLIKKKNVRFREIFYFLMGGIIILAPRIIFELRHQFLMTNSFLKFLLNGEVSRSVGLTQLIMDRGNMLFNFFNSTVALNSKLFGLILIIFIVISLALFYKKLSSRERNFTVTSIIVILTFFMGTVFFRHDIWSHYLVGLPVFFILILGMSINLISKKFKTFIFSSIIFAIIFLVNLNIPMIVSGVNKPLWEGDAAVYRNQLSVIDYVYKDADGKKFKYVVYTPPVYDYTYQYLFKWYGPKKYKYSSSINANLAYFILEPDFQNPKRLTDWLKKREGDGRIIKSEKVKGGIIVQTRIN